MNNFEFMKKRGRNEMEYSHEIIMPNDDIPLSNQTGACV